MSAPRDSLQILREYTCGCIVYRRYESTQSRWIESEETGLFCKASAGHKRALVQGQETQPNLFDAWARKIGEIA